MTQKLDGSGQFPPIADIGVEQSLLSTIKKELWSPNKTYSSLVRILEFPFSYFPFMTFPPT